MEQVTFIRVGIEGFGSIQEPVNFGLNAQGINMLCGANGAGKTTVFSALYWCIYGMLLKDVNTSDVATRVSRRTDKFRGTRVIVDFTKGDMNYRLARHLKFTGTTKGLKGGDSLMLFEKKSTDWDFTADDLQGDAKYKADIEEKVAGIIGLSAKAFLNAILFGQRMKRLVESDSKDKRALFEELFEMSFIERAKDKAKTRQSELEKSMLSVRTKCGELQLSVSSLCESMARKRKSMDEWEEKKKEKVSSAKKKFDEEWDETMSMIKEMRKLKKLANKYDENAVTELYNEVSDKHKKLADSTKRLNATKGDLDNAKDEVAKSEKNIAKYEKDLNEVETVCPYCGAELDKKSVDSVKKEIQTKIDREKNARTVMQTRVSVLESEVEKCKVTYKSCAKDYADADKKYKEFINNVSEYKKAFDDYRAKSASLIVQRKSYRSARKAWEDAEKDTMPDFDLSHDEKTKSEYERRIEELNEEQTKLETELARVNWWVSKGFGANGLKAFIFNAMLNRLNMYIEKYAEVLGVRVKFSVDVSKASRPFTTECYFDGDTVPYETLSGGEKQRVDVAMAFAMHDLVSHNANINVLIMDEVFEGLDSDGVEAVYELVRMKAETGKCVYIVTHAMELDSSFTKRIQVMYDSKRKTTYIV